jgi:hypothetical protein
MRVGFDVEVHKADETGLALSASGPVELDVDYRLADSAVHASISVRPRSGLTGRLLAEATGALLNAGALEAALLRLVREAQAAASTQSPTTYRRRLVTEAALAV